MDDLGDELQLPSRIEVHYQLKLVLNSYARTFASKFESYRHPLQKRKSSCILGLEKDSVFYNETVALVPGDKIILYTDGLTELENAEGRPWGARPMKLCLQAHAHEDPFALCKSLMKNAIGINKKGQVFDDDLTLLIIEFKHDESIAA